MTEPIILNLGDQQRGWYFNLYALTECAKLLKCDPLKVNENVAGIYADDPIFVLSLIVYCGFIGYEKSRLNIFHGYTPELVSGWLLSCDMETLTPVWDAFKQASGMGQFLSTLPTESTDEEKKS